MGAQSKWDGGVWGQLYAGSLLSMHFITAHHGEKAHLRPFELNCSRDQVLYGIEKNKIHLMYIRSRPQISGRMARISSIPDLSTTLAMVIEM